MLRVADEIKKAINEYDRKKGGHKKVMSYVSYYADNNDIKTLRAIHKDIGENESLNIRQWGMLIQLLKERSKNQKQTSYKLLSDLENTLFGDNAEKIINHKTPTKLASEFVRLFKNDLLTTENCVAIARAKNPKTACEEIVNGAESESSLSESSSEISREPGYEPDLKLRQTSAYVKIKDRKASDYQSAPKLRERSNTESSLDLSLETSEESSSEESNEKSTKKTNKPNNDVMLRNLLKSLKSRNQLTDENRAIVMAEKNPKVLWAFKILVESNEFTLENIQAIKANKHPIDLANSYHAQRLHNMFGGSKARRADKTSSHHHEEFEKKIPKL